MFKLRFRLGTYDNKRDKTGNGKDDWKMAEKPGNGVPGTKKKKSRKRKLVKRLIWTFVILLVLGAAGWSAYSSLVAEYKITYDPYTATTGSISNSLSFSGSMQLINSAAYTAPEEGKVREIYVSAGDTVKEGDKLVRLSNGETVKAGFDGTVGSVEVEKGDEVAKGDSLLTLADFNHMKVSVRVGESNIRQVAEGQKCRVTVASAGATFESVIDSIDHISYSGNNVAYYTTIVQVDTTGTEGIWPGMQATVTVPLEEAKDVTVLKMDALSTARDNTAYVYKENGNGEMEEVAVTVGVSNGNYVEIRSGVEAGETVYKVAEKEEQATGIAALFAGLFTSQQVNRPGSGRNQNGSGGSSFPGGGTGWNGGTGGNGGNDGSSGTGGGSRGR